MDYAPPIRQFVTGTALARKADVPQSTFSKLLREGKIRPDAVAERYSLFDPARVLELTHQLRKAA